VFFCFFFPLFLVVSESSNRFSGWLFPIVSIPCERHRFCPFWRTEFFVPLPISNIPLLPIRPFARYPLCSPFPPLPVALHLLSGAPQRLRCLFPTRGLRPRPFTTTFGRPMFVFVCTYHGPSCLGPVLVSSHAVGAPPRGWFWRVVLFFFFEFRRRRVLLPFGRHPPSFPFSTSAKAVPLPSPDLYYPPPWVSYISFGFATSNNP